MSMRRSAMHGCIPVFFDDGVAQPFHDILPYHEFSVRLSWCAVGWVRHCCVMMRTVLRSMSDISNMVEILEAISPHQVLRLYMGLARHYKAFVWPQGVGGEAYYRTLDSLFKRADRVQATL
eukprot:364356-Chlamydomonas_euryale.AAC.6